MLTLRITAGALTSFLYVITSPLLTPRTERAFFELLFKTAPTWTVDGSQVVQRAYISMIDLS